ncbi:ABC transporter permease, partial [candidate division KSB1 bacterium]
MTVTGIIQDPPENSTIRFDFLAPVRLFGDFIETSWSSGSQTFVLLKENVAVNDFRQKISDITTKYDNVTGLSRVTDIEKITDIRLYNMNGQDPVVYLYIFASIAVIILLLACTNYIILTTARAGNRTREIGIRKVTGAYKKDLIMQFFGESMLLISVAGMISVFLVYLFLPSFNNLSSKNLTLNFAEDISLLLWFTGIIVFTGIVSGSYPAVILSSFKPVNILKGQL